MNWSDFYLVCFLIGFGLSALALLAGSVHLHIPHVHFHHGIHIGHGALRGPGGRSSNELPWFNFGTIAAFLAWFGGAGYILEHYYHVWVALAILLATFCGLGGSCLVFLFLAKVLMADDQPLNPADYEMVGVLGRVTIPIRIGGTGELVYSQEGTRHVTGARSEDGTPVPKGKEVIVTRYEKGIAYVRLWEDPAGELEQKL
jgi:membrane protein implicated in regulation of membrane protease activity